MEGEGGFITTFSVIFIIFGVYSSTPVVKITENAVMQYCIFSNFYYFCSRGDPPQGGGSPYYKNSNFYYFCRPLPLTPKIVIFTIFVDPSPSLQK